MAIGVLFAVLAVLCGVAVTRAVRAPLSLAPVAGVAAMAVLTSWCGSLGVAPIARSGLVVSFALAGLAAAATTVSQAKDGLNRCRLAIGLIGLAVVIPTLMLGVAFAGVEAPVSTHDGAFHVETVEKLRLGAAVIGWYPAGFHNSVATVLGLVPWVDSARGTFEAAQGLAILAPLAVFSLGLALGMEATVSAGAAVVLALTWTYPYDYHLWAGWPQGMGVLLLIGLCATALEYTRRPSARLALLGGLIAGATVLSHGTEVYSAVLALAVIAAVRYRHLARRSLAWQLPLAAVAAIVATGPYVSTLLGWAGAGGASAAGGETLATGPAVNGRGDWLQFALGVTGSASFIDLPVRVACIALGLIVFRARLSGALWLTFVGLLLVVDLVNVPPVSTLFAVTYPWLDHDRPKQVAVIFASLLVACGLTAALGYVKQWRIRLWRYPNAWRRLAIVGVVLLAFFAEGSGVSIYKKLAQSIAEQNVYSADDAAAMAWLRQHAVSGELVANDLAGDAGIWAPYKANVPILLPRSATGATFEAREPILLNLVDLSRAPTAAHQACIDNVRYVFHGPPPLAFDERVYTDRAVLEHAPGLEEVFTSGETAVFRVNLACAN